MTVAELSAIIEAFAPEIRAFVAEEVKAFASRLEQIEALKTAPQVAGLQGERGERGDKGDMGERGNRIVIGEGEPIATDARDGDVYLNTQTGDIYQCR